MFVIAVGLLIIAAVCSTADSAAMVILYILLGLPLYCLPTLMAWKKGSRNLTAIAVLNLLAGWTFLGWVGALVWALYREA